MLAEASRLPVATARACSRSSASLIKVTDSRAGRGQRTTTHQGTQVIEDLEGHLREWFTQQATRFAVIRPDRYVAAHANETSLGAAINRLRGLLVGAPAPGGRDLRIRRIRA